MAKHQWDFSVANKDTAYRDCVLIVHDDKTGTVGHFALDGYTGDGDWGDCIYAESGFREQEAEAAAVIWGWI